MYSNFNEDHRNALGLENTQHKSPKVYPYINHMYNMYMNGVDVLDQLVAAYDRQHRFKNWKHHTAWSILLVIAYKMYLFNCNNNNQRPLSHKLFNQSVAKDLIKRSTPRDILSSSPPDLISEIVLHPYHTMKKRSHCRYLVENTLENRKKEMRQCQSKTFNACIACKDGKENVMYLCKTHYKLHSQ